MTEEILKDFEKLRDALEVYHYLLELRAEKVDEAYILGDARKTLRKALFDALAKYRQELKP